MIIDEDDEDYMQTLLNDEEVFGKYLEDMR